MFKFEGLKVRGQGSRSSACLRSEVLGTCLLEEMLALHLGSISFMRTSSHTQRCSCFQSRVLDSPARVSVDRLVAGSGLPRRRAGRGGRAPRGGKSRDTGWWAPKERDAQRRTTSSGAFSVQTCREGPGKTPPGAPGGPSAPRGPPRRNTGKTRGRPTRPIAREMKTIAVQRGNQKSWRAPCTPGASFVASMAQAHGGLAAATRRPQQRGGVRTQTGTRRRRRSGFQHQLCPALVLQHLSPAASSLLYRKNVQGRPHKMWF